MYLMHVPDYIDSEVGLDSPNQPIFLVLMVMTN